VLACVQGGADHDADTCPEGESERDRRTTQENANGRTDACADSNAYADVRHRSLLVAIRHRGLRSLSVNQNRRSIAEQPEAEVHTAPAQRANDATAWCTTTHVHGMRRSKATIVRSRPWQQTRW
jgi:hypothetical protein